MDKKKRYGHITNPATVISLLVAIFGFGVTRGTLNNRINRIEEFQQTVDMVQIQSTLSSIQKDIEWIKIELRK